MSHPTPFLSTLNETNSKHNPETNEYELTEAEYNFESCSVGIRNSPCKIFSKVGSVINCKIFLIKSNDVTIDGIEFHSAFHALDSSNISISHCTFTNFEKSDTIQPGCVSISRSNPVSMSYISILKPSINGKVGLLVTDNSTLNADHITIAHCDQSLLVVRSSSTLSLHESSLNDAKENGIYSLSNSTIEVDNCQFTKIEYPAISSFKSHVTITNCQINDIQQALSLHGCPDFLIKRNNIMNVNNMGITILENSTGKISHNTITKLKGNGIYIGEQSNAKVYENVLSECDYPSVLLTSNSKARVYKNTITKMGIFAISCRNASIAKLKHNTISDCEECGISVSDSEKVYISHNTISQCKVSGVEVYNDSVAKIYKNEFKDIDQTAVLAYTKARVKFYQNQLSNINIAMARLSNQASGQFYNNSIENCNFQLIGQTEGRYLFYGNGDFPGITNSKRKAVDGITYQEPIIDPTRSLCSKCHKNKINCFILKCAHLVYCKECADEALKNKENCPLCRFPIEGVTPGFSIEDNDICSICSDKHADSVVVPCGHLGFCHDCLNRWFSSSNSCPFCRCEPASFKKLMKV